MMKTIASIVGGSAAGFVVFLLCLPLGLQSSYRSTLATVCVGAGAMGAAAGDATRKKYERLMRQQALSQSQIETIFVQLETDFAKSGGTIHELVALQQVRESVKEAINGKRG